MEGDLRIAYGSSGRRSALAMSWIEASRASIRVDIWFTVGLEVEV